MALSDIAGDGVGTLAPGDAETGRATHTITVADITSGSFSNVGLASGDAPRGDPTDPTDDITDTDPETVTLVNLSLTKTSVVSQVTATFTNTSTVTATNGSPDSATTIDASVVKASAITYTLTVTNSGDADATNVSLSDTLPSGTTVTANPDGGIVGVGTITWSLGTVLGSGGTATVSVTVQTTNP